MDHHEVSVGNRKKLEKLSIFGKWATFSSTKLNKLSLLDEAKRGYFMVVTQVHVQETSWDRQLWEESCDYGAKERLMHARPKLAAASGFL